MWEWAARIKKSFSLCFLVKCIFFSLYNWCIHFVKNYVTIIKLPIPVLKVALYYGCWCTGLFQTLPSSASSQWNNINILLDITLLCLSNLFSTNCIVQHFCQSFCNTFDSFSFKMHVCPSPLCLLVTSFFIPF